MKHQQADDSTAAATSTQFIKKTFILVLLSVSPKCRSVTAQQTDRVIAAKHLIRTGVSVTHQ